MNYKDYQKTRDVVWKLLIDLEVSELPVPIVKICRELGIKVKYFNLSEETDGVSLFIEGVPYILIDRKVSPERQRFTIAHELGHILLGHVGKYNLVNREITPSDNPIEQAANVFASRLLAPACVLWGCGVTKAQQIAKMCHISKTASEYRMERMTVLYQRNKFLSSPLEKRVFTQFENYIKNNKF